MKEDNTAQKKQIIAFLKLHSDHHYTVDEITKAVSTDRGAGKSTVYRQISKLMQSGVIRRFETPGVKSFVYQYANHHDNCDSHYHLKCVKCGRLIHLECSKLDEVRAHIISEHDFIIGCGESVIYGQCTACANEGKNNQR